MDILHELNEKQKEAVEQKDGPILVIAGPGTGKTRVITHRIANLIREYSIRPENILAITFTNKAAQEMRDRVIDEIGDPHGPNVNVRTFHSFCVKVLRDHAIEIELNENFAIFDQEIQDEILTEIVKDLNLNSNDYPSWRLRNVLSEYKHHVYDKSQTFEIDSDILLDIDDENAESNIREILDAYQKKLSGYHALDFDDLLLKSVELFEKSSTVLEQYHNQLSYILVDEYHDVNKIQYRLLQQLCPTTDSNLMVVADGDQAIYSWRGSDPIYIDKLREDYSPKIITLDDHYRCSKTILRAAQEVIAKNPTWQKERALKSVNEDGRDIFHYTFYTATEEARSVIKLIQNLVKQRGYSYRDIAVFYRTHKLADVLSEQLNRTEIQYQRIRPTNALDDEHLKGILSYLCFLEWGLPRDYETAINFPERRIDELTWVRLKWLAKRKGIELSRLLEYVEDFREDVGPLTRHKIRMFRKQIYELKHDIQDEKIGVIGQELLKKLALSRSPYRGKELSIIENYDEIQNLGVVQDVLYSAIDLGEPIRIIASYGIDEYCATEIIRQTLTEYLDQDVDIQYLPKQDTLNVPNNTPILKENSVNILIGDFTELQDREFGTRIISIGSIPDKNDVIHLGNAVVRSVVALKLCQRLLSRFETPNMSDMVMYDLETTGVNTKRAQIVEIAAMRLNGIGEKIDDYHRLVKPPGGDIPPSATKIHGIRKEDVENEPSIETILPEFCNFIGDSILVGHNIAQYDNLILERDMKDILSRGLSNPYYDTLITARRLLRRQRRGIEALVEKFGIAHNTLHRAMEDVEVNRQIFQKLVQIDLKKQELKSLPELLPLVGIGILSKSEPDERNEFSENIAYLNAAYRYIKIHPISFPEDIPLDFEEREQVEESIKHLQEKIPPILQEDTDWLENEARFKNMLLKFEKADLGDRLIDFLGYQKLLTNLDEIDNSSEQVTLMTLHAAKGTEYPVVIIIGMEDGSFPIWRHDMTQAELEEERRLFYVGMTRAQKQLFLSTTVYRQGNREHSTSMFVREVSSDYMVKWSSFS
ncbi:UvrD-helicase domain-containing protein [Candidatus Poribacteria bacterium]|nr:UvrD-helicase domain-containing protein [Candidatus Poribacteria bacterium]